MAILLEFLIVVLAAAAAWFYPVYGTLLPAQFAMDATEAHWMAVYLLAIGVIFAAVRRRKTAPAAKPPPAELPAGRQPGRDSDSGPPHD